jgi:hypothetical protein
MGHFAVSLQGLKDTVQRELLPEEVAVSFPAEEGNGSIINTYHLFM